MGKTCPRNDKKKGFVALTTLTASSGNGSQTKIFFILIRNTNW